MKKSLTTLIISLLVFACSHKTATIVTTTVAKTSSATVTNEQYADGDKIFKMKCGRCHALKNPGKYTLQEWTKWLDKMAPKARLNDDQKAQVFNFVSVNAKGN